MNVDLVDAIKINPLMKTNMLTENLEIGNRDDATLPTDHAHTTTEMLVTCAEPKIFINTILAETPNEIPPELHACIEDTIDDELLVEVFTPLLQKHGKTKRTTPQRNTRNMRTLDKNLNLDPPKQWSCSRQIAFARSPC